MKFIAATIFIGLIVAAAAHPPTAADANDNNVVASAVAAAAVADVTTTAATATPTITSNDKQSKDDDTKPITEASAESSADQPKSIDEKLPVKIYYEGLCPDSRKLLSDLGREYYVFRKFITLDFVPFGRAKSLDANGNAFECHHGPK